MLAELGRFCTVRAYNFTLQYPSILFPGKTQYVQDNDPEALQVESEALLSTVNPFSWYRTAKAIREWGADVLILRYWMSWFAPSLGTVARHVGPGCKVVAVMDNVIPHETHFFDKPLTRWFLKAVDGCITMSDEVAADLLRWKPDARHAVLPHPLYTHFGEPVSRDEAQTRLGLGAGMKTLLFCVLLDPYACTISSCQLFSFSGSARFSVMGFHSRPPSVKMLRQSIMGAVASMVPSYGA